MHDKGFNNVMHLYICWSYRPYYDNMKVLKYIINEIIREN